MVIMDNYHFSPSELTNLYLDREDYKGAYYIYDYLKDIDDKIKSQKNKASK